MFVRTAPSVALITAVAVTSCAAPAFAAGPLTLYPERIGAETARFTQGVATVRLTTPAGTVEVRPLSADKGQAAFSLVVVNQGVSSANFGVENVSATLDGVPVAVPTRAQLADQAQRKAREAKIGAALFAGAVAGLVSGASNEGAYYQHVRGPHGGYTREVRWEDNTPGVIGATTAVAGGALAIQGVDDRLADRLDRLDGQILQTTTVDPGERFGGMIVVPIDRQSGYPVRIQLQVTFNGAVYPFAFLLAPAVMAPAAPPSSSPPAAPPIAAPMSIPAQPSGAPTPPG
ncbi:hypothetical protein [Caulobacter sp.]|uniref:hypothetical protein n=1 Tax=Caulobacter sp. TaxID=78 RepID=UPI0031CFA267